MRLSAYLLAGILGTLLLSMFLTNHRKSTEANHADDTFEKLRPELKSAAFIGSDFAWVLGHKSGDLWHTKNGGRNWQEVPAKAVGGKFHAASFLNEKKGWAVGDGGTIWRSDDGGSTWARISKLEIFTPNDWSFISSEQIRFFDDLTGWLVETFGVWRTEDSGINWKRVLAIGDPGITGQPANVAFLSSGRAVVGSGDGKVYRTEDGGIHWQTQTLIEQGDFRGISFVNDQTGWLNGYGSPDWDFTIYRTEDGGRKWQPFHIKDRDRSIYSIQFLTKEEGWAVGSLRQPHNADLGLPRGLLMHTTDGGESWATVPVLDGERSFEDIHFADASHGWLFAPNSVYRTEDGGKTWRAVLTLPIKDASHVRHEQSHPRRSGAWLVRARRRW
jgi:photosystem II stability/assembly factor-like uncharacterized protein